jgi:hypothetical protein
MGRKVELHTRELEPWPHGEEGAEGELENAQLWGKGCEQGTMLWHWEKRGVGRLAGCWDRGGREDRSSVAVTQ